MLEFLVGFFIAIPMWAVIEYWWHRLSMHSSYFGKLLPIAWRSFEAHTQLHHWHFGGQEVNFVAGDENKFPHINKAFHYVSDGVDPLWNVFGSAVVWFPVGYFWSWWAALGFVVVAWLHGFLWTAFHHEMHWPRNPWWSKTRVFLFVRNNHKIHHLRPSSNFCALLPPVMDLIMGTRRSS